MLDGFSLTLILPCKDRIYDTGEYGLMNPYSHTFYASNSANLNKKLTMEVLFAH